MQQQFIEVLLYARPVLIIEQIAVKKTRPHKLGMVTNACNPSYSGGQGRQADHLRS